MASLSVSDIVLLVVIGFVGYWFFLRDSSGSFAKAPQNNSSLSSSTAGGNAQAGADVDSAGRDFVKALSLAKKKCIIFYGSQTGTAEDYATRIAKEAKSRFGVSSLVCDPEEYDFDNLDAVPEDTAVIFVMATYGEGEPTDNAVQLMEFIKEESVSFSQGDRIDNLKYVVFSLGNKTYEHYCAVGRDLDAALAKHGARLIGTRGEGDDDKSLEEDYLEWKDGMFEALAEAMGWQEGAGADSADFEVTEQPDLSWETDDSVYAGELSQRMLTGTKGIHDTKNPYIAPLLHTKELFAAGDRNCIHAEFDIEGSGLRYQTGDHVGVWPINPDDQVHRWLKLLGLEEKKDTAVQIVSLDPLLAKVPFPTPATYEAIFRHYVDVSALASRQSLASFANFAPTESAKQFLLKLGQDKAAYHTEIMDKGLRLSEALLKAAGDATDSPSPTVWPIPFDRVVSAIQRLQPRFYSISSSPKLYPNAIHITAVVLKYAPVNPENGKVVYGAATNYLLNLKKMANHEDNLDVRSEGSPIYRLEGPRGRFKKGAALCTPIHVRRSNFRLPTSPKVPVMMIGPGTGVAPFRGFVQERVALARKAIDKAGPDALNEWGTISLFYGCRRSSWDYLYQHEWPEYEKELGDKFKMFTAFSREPGEPKTYVQQLLAQQENLVKDLVAKKGYIYICGDARHMAHEVEELLKDILGRAKGGTKEKEGEAEWKMMKDRNRILLDVWS